MVPLMLRLVINYACYETKSHHTYYEEFLKFEAYKKCSFPLKEVRKEEMLHF